MEPGSIEWDARIARLVTEEASEPVAWWYLSFAGDEGFRGAVLVQANGPTSAMILTHLMKINPGGAIRFWGPFPTLPPTVLPSMCNRLLNRQEAETLGKPAN